MSDHTHPHTPFKIKTKSKNLTLFSVTISLMNIRGLGINVIFPFTSVNTGLDKQDYKKAEGRRIDVFELWCWRRLLSIPWTARRSNQSILKEISPDCSLEGLMLKLKLQYFGHLMWRADSQEKTVMLGKTEGRRRRGWQEDEMAGWHHRLSGHGFG